MNKPKSERKEKKVVKEETPKTKATISEKVYLTIEDIATADDLPVTDVEIEGWGGVIQMRGMTIGQRLDYYKNSQDEDGERDLEKMTIDAVIQGVVNPDLTEKHIPMLKERNPGILDDILYKYLELSGVDVDAAVNARKNSSEETESD